MLSEFVITSLVINGKLELLLYIVLFFDSMNLIQFFYTIQFTSRVIEGSLVSAFMQTEILKGFDGF